MTPQELCDIDKKVAEAIGAKRISIKIPSTGEPEQCWQFPDEKKQITFRPSTDWNQAMYAAEKAGLTGVLVDTPSRGLPFFLCFPDQLKERGLAGSVSESGPLAICNAILSLKGKT